MSSLTRSLTQRVVGPYGGNSLSARARVKRWRVFAETFPNISEMSVLDLGGTAQAWRLAPVRPAHLTLWNLFPQNVPDEPWIEPLIKDACNPGEVPAGIDLIYSNSVIEHVGGHWRRERFAEAVRTADRYWVQTPNRYFILEPHFMFPWLQHLPFWLRKTALLKWPFGHGVGASNVDEALQMVLDIDLLSLTELRFYFPDAEIFRERAGGLTKSLVAFKCGD